MWSLSRRFEKICSLFTVKGSLRVSKISSERAINTQDQRINWRPKSTMGQLHVHTLFPWYWLDFLTLTKAMCCFYSWLLNKKLHKKSLGAKSLSSLISGYWKATLGFSVNNTPIDLNIKHKLEPVCQRVTIKQSIADHKVSCFLYSF